MKKIFLAVLCAGLFFACGNKKTQEPEALVDSAACCTEEVAEEVSEEIEEVVEEAPVAENTTTKKTTTTTTKKNTTSNYTTSNETPTVKEQAENAANRVAGKAIEKAETEATNTIVNSGKKKR